MSFRIALAQINSTVGDLAGNQKKILDNIAQARSQRAQVVAFPELAITGYPPEDLLLKPGFVAANLARLEDIARQVQGITAIVGFVDRDSDIYNAAAVLHNGQIAAVYRKMYLPNYSVFDENRYFGVGGPPINLRLSAASDHGLHQDPVIGFHICEDLSNTGARAET